MFIVHQSPAANPLHVQVGTARCTSATVCRGVTIYVHGTRWGVMPAPCNTFLPGRIGVDSSQIGGTDHAVLDVCGRDVRVAVS